MNATIAPSQSTTVETWVKKLEQESVLVKSIHDGEQFYHLNTPAQFAYPSAILEEIKSGYHAEEEKGGYIIFQHSVNKNTVVLTAVSVEWVANVSETPKGSYTVNTPAHKQIERETYARQLFPIRFHTHPLDVTHIDYRRQRSLEIIDTSDADKSLSYELPFTAQHVKILMPDVLIVWDIDYMNSFFIGTYNGLIAPVGFLEQRLKTTREFNRKIGEDIMEWVDEKSDWEKVALGLGGIATIFAAIKYPQVSSRVITHVKNENPIFAVASQKENTYLGFARASPIFGFAINIPKATKELIEQNNEEVKNARERWGNQKS